MEEQRDMFVNTPHGLGFADDVVAMAKTRLRKESPPLPPPKAKRLSKPSQKDRLLAYLKEHRTITKDEGREKLGILNVGGRIEEIRKEHGYDTIRTEMITVRNRFQEETEIAKYIYEGG